MERGTLGWGYLPARAPPHYRPQVCQRFHEQLAHHVIHHMNGLCCVGYCTACNKRRTSCPFLVARCCGARDPTTWCRWLARVMSPAAAAAAAWIGASRPRFAPSLCPRLSLVCVGSDVRQFPSTKRMEIQRVSPVQGCAQPPARGRRLSMACPKSDPPALGPKEGAQC